MLKAVTKTEQMKLQAEVKASAKETKELLATMKKAVNDNCVLLGKYNKGMKKSENDNHVLQGQYNKGMKRMESVEKFGQKAIDMLKVRQ